jgi:hypothetical protein
MTAIPRSLKTFCPPSERNTGLELKGETHLTSGVMALHCRRHGG